MGSLKSSLLVSIATFSFVTTAWAQVHHQSAHHDGMFDVGMDDSDLHEDTHQLLQIQREEFLRDLPADPEKALEYIFEKLNTAEQMEGGRNVIYTIKQVDNVNNSEMIDVKSRITEDNKVYFDFYLQKSLAKNPIYLLETLKVLQTFVTDSVFITWHEKSSYLKYHTYEDHHGDYKTDYTKHKHVHYLEQMSHAMLEALGLPVTSYDKRLDRPLSWAERIINAKNGSAYAAREIKARELGSAKAAMMNFPGFSILKSLNDSDKKAALLQIAKERHLTVNSNQSVEDLAIEYFTKRAEKAQQELDVQDKAAREQYRKEKQWFDSPAVKAKKDQMEDAPKKLDDLVKSNDREGVAKLLEAFLPLEIMEPIERGIWVDWIEAIRHPDTKNSKLLFRGLDRQNDKPQVSESGGKPGFFSTLLVRNQGNYTRRLRSFSTMRYRFQNLSKEVKSPVEAVPSIAAMMLNHSVDPSGSPMLSFSTSMKIAKSFADSGILAAKIDQRRFMPNIMSGFGNELEILVPLIVFPDEVVAVEMVEKDQKVDITRFEATLNKILGHPYEQEIIIGTKEVYLGAYKVFADAQESGGGLQCRGIFK